MNYEPKALPPHLQEIYNAVAAAKCPSAYIVGSALRDADNGNPVQSYSLYVMPDHGSNVERSIAAIHRNLSQGTARERSVFVAQDGVTRHEFRLGSGPLLRVTPCTRDYMLDASSMARNVPVHFSAIVLDLFTRQVDVTTGYRLDKSEGTISLARTDGLPAARSIQTVYPDHPILGVDGRPMVPAKLARTAPAA